MITRLPRALYPGSGDQPLPMQEGALDYKCLCRSHHFTWNTTTRSTRRPSNKCISLVALVMSSLLSIPRATADTPPLQALAFLQPLRYLPRAGFVPRCFRGMLTTRHMSSSSSSQGIPYIAYGTAVEGDELPSPVKKGPKARAQPKRPGSKANAGNGVKDGVPLPLPAPAHDHDEHDASYGFVSAGDSDDLEDFDAILASDTLESNSRDSNSSSSSSTAQRTLEELERAKDIASRLQLEGLNGFGSIHFRGSCSDSTLDAEEGIFWDTGDDDDSEDFDDSETFGDFETFGQVWDGEECDEDELPSTTTLLAAIDVLAVLEGGATTDSGVLYPELEEEQDKDEETTRLKQMSDQDPLHNPGLRQVLVVIGKHLVRDQVTVEYASRIRRLVQGLKSGRLQPDLVCFTGGRVRDNKVADASAGYIFFRHLCEQHQVDTCDIGFLVESESTCTKEAMMNVVKEVSRLEREEMQDMEEDRPGTLPRQKYHFTLISNEYHLSRVMMVHETSERVSLLSPLKQLEASWGYEHVAYPYACYDDPSKMFQADVYKTLEELVPLQVNVQAVASREEFFQEENYASLTHVRERLSEFIKEIHSSRGARAQTMNLVDIQRAAGEGGQGKIGASPAGSGADMRLDEALEWAAGALAKIQEIIEPAAKRRNSVSLRAWAMCAALLERAILQAQMASDPDRPLTPAEWGVLEDEKPPPETNDKASIAARAQGRVHSLFDGRGGLWDRATGFSTAGETVLRWEGADAMAGLTDADLPAERLALGDHVDLLPQSQSSAGDIINERAEAGGLPARLGIAVSTAARHGGGGSFEAEPKGDDSDIREGGGLKGDPLGKRAGASRTTTVGKLNGRASAKAQAGDITFEADRRVGGGGVGGVNLDDGDMPQQAAEMEHQQPKEPRVNWALPRPPRRRKTPLPPPTPPPMPPPAEPKPAKPKSPGRPKTNGPKASVPKASVAKASVAKARVAKASVAKASVAKASVAKASVAKASVAKASGTKVKVAKARVNNARVKAAVKPTTSATPATPPKRVRARPRVASARPAVVARDDGDDG